MLLLQLHLKGTCIKGYFIVVFCGEDIYDNHSVLKYIPTIKTT